MAEITQEQAQEMVEALRIIRTWASVPGCLHADWVRELWEKYLKEANNVNRITRENSQDS